VQVLQQLDLDSGMSGAQPIKDSPVANRLINWSLILQWMRQPRRGSQKNCVRPQARRNCMNGVLIRGAEAGSLFAWCSSVSRKLDEK
jgi:hypothetical protein